MTIPNDAQQKIDAYLRTLRRRLRDVNEDEVSDFAEELRSHILDKAADRGELTAAGVDAALTSLGSPDELAAQYATDVLLARAQLSRSPVRILESLFHWASLSAAGFFVLIGSIVGYLLGCAFLLCALLKPLHPRTAGLWTLPDPSGGMEISLRLGFGTPPAGGQELLGWWIVPLGLVVGLGLVMLTTRFALWSARQFRRSPGMPG
jgi:hypothetical protein